MAIIPLLLWGRAVFGQIAIEEDLDLSIFSEESISPELAAWLDELHGNRIDLRRTSVEDLATIPGISRGTAGQVLDLMDSGEVTTFAELQTAGDLPDEVIRILEWFTFIGPDRPEAPSDDPWEVEIRTRVTLDLQTVRGLRDTLRRIVVRESPNGNLSEDTLDLGPRYIGPGGGVTTRVLASSPGVRFGLLVDRDPGEPLIYHDTIAYDYSSNERVTAGGLNPPVRSGLGSFISGFGEVTTGSLSLLVGDYSLAFGSGLLLGRPFSGRKGGSATRDPIATGLGVRPYTSRSESGYYRGAVIGGGVDSIGQLRLQGHLFLSRRFHDGSVGQDESGSAEFSIDEAGLLATRTDLRRDDRIEERIAGLRLEGRNERYRIGATIYRDEISIRQNSTIDTVPTGLTAYPMAIDGEWGSKSIGLSGELALGRSGWGLASVARFHHGRADGTLALRHYSEAFDSPHGVSFAESPTRPAGETGIYAGLRLRPVRHIGFECYVDLYRQSRGEPSWPFASIGNELMARLRWRPDRELELEGSIRSEAAERDGRGVDGAGRTVARSILERSSTARLGLTWSTTDRVLALRLRFQYRREESEEILEGNILMADFRFRPWPTIRFGTRWTVFNGPGSGLQLYALEQDLPGGMSLASLSGRGQRYYLLALYSPVRSVDLGARYAETWYADREVIRPGSVREIEGRRLSTLTLQVDIRI